MLDFVLACARKEPHYRIYFWPSLGIALGRRFFDPTVMPLLAPESHTTLGPFVSIPTFLVPSSPRNNYFCHPCGFLCKSQNLHWILLQAQNWLASVAFKSAAKARAHLNCQAVNLSARFYPDESFRHCNVCWTSSSGP